MRLKNLTWVALIFVVAACGGGTDGASEPGVGAEASTLGDVQCAAYPSCDAGDTEVQSSSDCLQDDAACYQRELCGSTIWCTGPRAPIQCEAYPSCDAGDTQVQSSTDCLQDDAACYQRELCGYTIWCTGPRP